MAEAIWPYSYYNYQIEVSTQFYSSDNLDCKTVDGLGEVVKETTDITAKGNFVLLRKEAAQSMGLQKMFYFFKSQKAR